MTNDQRKQLVIEPEIQYSLVRQLCGQWALHVVASLTLLIMLQMLLGGFFRPWSEHWSQIAPVVASIGISLLFLLPIYLRNSLKLSNRFVGPIHRFRRELRNIASGEPHQPIQFRDEDFWPTIADELRAAMEAIESRARAVAASHDSLDAGSDNIAPGGGVILPGDGSNTPDTPTS